jgi:hypothetical protein
MRKMTAVGMPIKMVAAFQPLVEFSSEMNPPVDTTGIVGRVEHSNSQPLQAETYVPAAKTRKNSKSVAHTITAAHLAISNSQARAKSRVTMPPTTKMGTVPS